MLDFVKGVFSGLVYIQIWEKRLKVVNVNNRMVFDEEPLIALSKNKKGEEVVTAIGNGVHSMADQASQKISNPFSHPRLLVSEFQKAEKIIQHAIRAVHQNKLFNPSPKVVIHPMEKLEGGLTEIEVRVFRELAIGAGSRESLVYTGPELSVATFNLEEIAKSAC